MYTQVPITSGLITLLGMLKVSGISLSHPTLDDEPYYCIFIVVLLIIM